MANAGKWIGRGLGGLFVLYVLAIVGECGLSPWSTQRKIELGMTEAQVVAAVGRAPDQRGDGLLGCKAPPSWHGDCAALAASGALTLLVWRAGIDARVVAGLGPDGKVVFRGRFDS